MSPKAKAKSDPPDDPTPDAGPVHVPEDDAHVLKRYALKKQKPFLSDDELDRMARES